MRILQEQILQLEAIKAKHDLAAVEFRKLITQLSKIYEHNINYTDPIVEYDYLLSRLHRMLGEEVMKDVK